MKGGVGKGVMGMHIIVGGGIFLSVTVPSHPRSAGQCESCVDILRGSNLGQDITVAGR